MKRKDLIACLHRQRTFDKYMFISREYFRKYYPKGIKGRRKASHYAAYMAIVFARLLGLDENVLEKYQQDNNQ